MCVRMKQNNFFKRVKRLFVRTEEVSKEKGIYYVIRAGIRIIFNLLMNPFGYLHYKIFKSSRTFKFQKDTYNYFYHKYNSTWKNERAVEVPIIWEMVKKYHNHKQKILEVGNVLSHYFPVNHVILDKYEKADGVVNQDVIDFQPPKKYDLIVSISTLEHVGWDEKPREPMKILQAIENLEKCLVPGGKIVISLPLGSNFIMDKLLNDGKIQFTKMYCLKRISKDNKWIEIGWKDINNARYNYPFPKANGLVIGIIEKE